MKLQWRLKVGYPNGSKEVLSFDTEAEARDRADHLCHVHKCIVDMDKTYTKEVCSWHPDYIDGQNRWRKEPTT